MFGDSSVIKLGAGADLKLSHDGSNSYIEDVDDNNVLTIIVEKDSYDVALKEKPRE